MAALYLKGITQGHWVYAAFAILFWLPLGVGLWRVHPIARKVMIGVLWVFTVLVPIGLASPFALMEYNSRNMPSTLFLVLRVMIPTTAFLISIYVLSNHKKEFMQSKAAT
jgi:hypothetical protein